MHHKRKDCGPRKGKRQKSWSFFLNVEVVKKPTLKDQHQRQKRKKNKELHIQTKSVMEKIRYFEKIS